MTSSNTMQFHISDVLSITTGALVSRDHIGGVYNILNWMTDSDLMTHQLPRASVAAEPVILKAYPQLAEVKYPRETIGDGDDIKDKIFDWVAEMAKQYGEFFDIPQMGKDDYAHMDPISELIEKTGNKPVVVINTP